MSRLPADKIVIDSNGCHVWQGHDAHHGYGKITIAGIREYVHRIAFEDAYGPIPPGHVVRHLCGNTRCVNRAHLASGTQKQNCADTVAMGRSTSGEKNPRAKLSQDQITRAFEMRDEGFLHKEIATELGVSRTAITLILNNKRWRKT